MGGTGWDWGRLSSVFCHVLRDPVACVVCVSLPFVCSVAYSWVMAAHIPRQRWNTCSRVLCALPLYKYKTKKMIKTNKSYLEPNTSHLMFHTFFPFIHLTHQRKFCFFLFLKLYTKSSPPQSSFLSHHSTKSLCLSLSLSFHSLSLRTGSLQHTQVIVLFGGPKFEETGPTVVKFEGSTLGSHSARKHSHYSVEVSRVTPIHLHSSRSSSWGTRATGSSSSASVRLLQPLDLGTTHRELVEELFSVWTWNPLWQVCYLQNST